VSEEKSNTVTADTGVNVTGISVTGVRNTLGDLPFVHKLPSSRGDGRGQQKSASGRAGAATKG
jgi:hypothetical protein